MRVVAIGRTGMLYNSILKIRQHGHEIVSIITGKEEKEYTRDASDFKCLSSEIGCQYIIVEDINQKKIIDSIKTTNPDIAVSINWKTLIGKDVITAFPYGIINAHAGDLPRYRGNAVPNWAIIAGESEIVATLHLMDTGLDSGPILLKRHFPLSKNTRIGEVYAYLEENFPTMFVEALEGIRNNSIHPFKQPANPADSLRCYPRMQRDGEIDWTAPAEKIHRLVRAVSEPFSGAYTYFGMDKLIIWRSTCDIPPFPYIGVPGQVAQRDPSSGTVKVVTGNGLLVLEEVEIAGTDERKKPADIIKTIRTHLGMDITDQISILKKRIDILEDRIQGLEKTDVHD